MGLETSKEYYESFVWQNTTWRGRTVLKPPTDLWRLQELIVKRKPDYIIETGTHSGGSALFYSDLCELLDNGQVVTVDIEKCEPLHPRMTCITGDCLEVVDEVRSRITKSDHVMVILDSDHRPEHVRKEIALYAPLVTKREFLVVEDTIPFEWKDEGWVNDLGPVVDEFLETHSNFKRIPDKYGILTFSPGGWLERV